MSLLSVKICIRCLRLVIPVMKLKPPEASASLALKMSLGVGPKLDMEICYCQSVDVHNENT